MINPQVLKLPISRINLHGPRNVCAIEVLLYMEPFIIGYIKNWAQLFKTNDIMSKHIVKILIVKYGINVNIFAEKMWVAFAFAKATHIFFQQKYLWTGYCTY